MAPLNLEEILGNIFKYSDGYARMEKIPINNALISFEAYLPHKFLSYNEIYLQLGVKRFIIGDHATGYEEKIEHSGTSVVEIRQYYGDCKLKSSGTKVIQYQYWEASYPVGETKFYSPDGRLTRVINYDDILKFSYNQVLSLLDNRIKDIKIGSVVAKGFDDKIPFWEVYFYSPTKGRSQIKINGRNGKIISENDHLFVIE